MANAQAKPIQIIKSDCLLATMTERSVSLQTNFNRKLGRFDVGIVTWCAFKGWGQSLAVKGKRRCRMHGGTNPGAPKGNRNAYKHGGRSAARMAVPRYDGLNPHLK